MELENVCNQLKDYISEDILEGKSMGLTPTTPLLEWGIINSLEIVRLSNFVKTSMGVDIPSEKLVAENLETIETIGKMVLDLQKEMV
ncbi:MAG: acyl carrier protein [Candidatus Margulisbacteria bacterium]|nr:acyl carrier protein [Candidatus Margulisiibacteriota bacterium]